MASIEVGPGADVRTTFVALYHPRLFVFPMKPWVLEGKKMVTLAPVSGFPEGSLLSEAMLTAVPASKLEDELVEPDRVAKRSANAFFDVV